jgi:hypothetical protein
MIVKNNLNKEKSTNRSKEKIVVENDQEKKTIIKRLKINTRNEKVLMTPRNIVLNSHSSYKASFLSTNSIREKKTITAMIMSGKESTKFNMSIGKKAQTPLAGLQPKLAFGELNSKAPASKVKTVGFSKFVTSKMETKAITARARLNTEDLISKISTIKISNSPMKERKSPNNVQISSITIISPKTTKLSYPKENPAAPISPSLKFKGLPPSSPSKGDRLGLAIKNIKKANIDLNSKS